MFLPIAKAVNDLPERPKPVWTNAVKHSNPHAADAVSDQGG